MEKYLTSLTASPSVTAVILTAKEVQVPQVAEEATEVEEEDKVTLIDLNCNYPNFGKRFLKYNSQKDRSFNGSHLSICTYYSFDLSHNVFRICLYRPCCDLSIKKQI